MDRTVEKPLDVHLLLPSEGESIKPQGRADVRKYRFYGSDPSVIDKATR